MILQITKARKRHQNPIHRFYRRNLTDRPVFATQSHNFKTILRMLRIQSIHTILNIELDTRKQFIRRKSTEHKKQQHIPSSIYDGSILLFNDCPTGYCILSYVLSLDSTTHQQESVGLSTIRLSFLEDEILALCFQEKDLYSPRDVY